MGIYSVENATKILSSNLIPWNDYKERSRIVKCTSICCSWGDLLSSDQRLRKRLLTKAETATFNAEDQWTPYLKTKKKNRFTNTKDDIKRLNLFDTRKQSDGKKAFSSSSNLFTQNWFDAKRLIIQTPPHRCLKQRKEQVIIDVWFDNLEEEFKKIRDVVEKFHYVAIDTEFPGVIASADPNTTDFQYKTTKYNVDLLNIIQLGITFANEFGELPEYGCTWQFNFKFDLSRDLYAQKSIQLLKQHGVDFHKHQMRGIDVESFGEMIMSSGLVMCENIKWISFHGVYDFGYLLKLLTCQPLPETEKQFFDLLHDFFPSLCDIKNIVLKECATLVHANSLTKLAKCLKVERFGEQHQAGSDSLVTCQVFFRLRNTYLKNIKKILVFSGNLYGLNPQTINHDHKNWDPKRYKYSEKRLKWSNFERDEWFE